jgi:hypothetical protein
MGAASGDVPTCIVTPIGEVLVRLEDVEAIAATIARATIRVWQEEQARASARLYGMKAIQAEVERIRGCPTPINTIWYWRKKLDFPIDRGRARDLSAVRWQIERWLSVVLPTSSSEGAPAAAAAGKAKR